MDVVVAIDIGTSETKCSLVDRAGRIVARASAGYPLSQDGPRHEQRPEDWWRATAEALRAALAGSDARPAAVVLSGQMQDAILVGDGGALPPTLLYSDTRAAAEAEVVTARIGAARLRELTGNLQDASGLLAKLLWLREHAPGSYGAAHTLFVGAHDYVAWKLCGARVADYTTASTTGLLDLRGNRWATEVLAELGLRHDWLPRLAPAAEEVGRVGAEAAEATGLPAGLPVLHGTGDVATTTIGSGAGEPGQLSIYLGTTGWLAMTSDGTPVDPETGIFNLRHTDPGRLIMVGPMLTAAGNLAWLREQFGGLEAPGQDDNGAYSRIAELAEGAAPGCRGLLYLPYLAGERSPFREPNARGVLFGMDRSTTRAEVYRAVLEGVAYAMRSIRDTMLAGERRAGQAANLVGGGARTGLWAQIFADVLGCEVRVLADPQDVGARGAAMIAGRALGWLESYRPPEGYLPEAAVLRPRPAEAAAYDSHYARFSTLVAALRHTFGPLAASPPTR